MVYSRIHVRQLCRRRVKACYSLLQTVQLYLSSLTHGSASCGSSGLDWTSQSQCAVISHQTRITHISATRAYMYIKHTPHSKISLQLKSADARIIYPSYGSRPLPLTHIRFSMTARSPSTSILISTSLLIHRRPNARRTRTHAPSAGPAAWTAAAARAARLRRRRRASSAARTCRRRQTSTCTHTAPRAQWCTGPRALGTVHCAWL